MKNQIIVLGAMLLVASVLIVGVGLYFGAGEDAQSKDVLTSEHIVNVINSKRFAKGLSAVTAVPGLTSRARSTAEAMATIDKVADSPYGSLNVFFTQKRDTYYSAEDFVNYLASTSPELVYGNYSTIGAWAAYTTPRSGGDLAPYITVITE